jgi:hypothetical protein
MKLCLTTDKKKKYPQKDKMTLCAFDKATEGASSSSIWPVIYFDGSV